MCFCWQGAADPRRQDITAFEQTCLESADPMLFLDAIMKQPPSIKLVPDS